MLCLVLLNRQLRWSYGQHNHSTLNPSVLAPHPSHPVILYGCIAMAISSGVDGGWIHSHQNRRTKAAQNRWQNKRCTSPRKPLLVISAIQPNVIPVLIILICPRTLNSNGTGSRPHAPRFLPNSISADNSNTE